MGGFAAIDEGPRSAREDAIGDGFAGGFMSSNGDGANFGGDELAGGLKSSSGPIGDNFTCGVGARFDAGIWN